MKLAYRILLGLAGFLLILVTSLFFAWRPPTAVSGGTTANLTGLTYGDDSDLIGLLTNGTLKPLYDDELWVGNQTCDASFTRRVDGRVGDVRCVPVNDASHLINGSCIPSLLLLENGKLAALDGTCTTITLGGTGATPGLQCAGDPNLIVTDINLTTDGRVSAVVCTPVNGTALNESAVGGDLTGFMPNPILITVNGDVGCFDFGAYQLCADGKGRITSVTSTGDTILLVGTAVSSTTNTITGTYGTSLDLATCGSPANYSFGDYLPSLTVDAYCRLTGATNSSVRAITYTTVLGGDLTGTLPNPTHTTVNSNVGCFNYGAYTECVDAKGRTTSVTATGSTVMLVGSSVTSNTNTITGTYGTTLDLASCGTAANYSFGEYIPYFNVDGYCRVTGAGNSSVHAITYTTVVSSSTLTGTFPSIELGYLYADNFDFGQNTSCLLAGRIDRYGLVENRGCFSVASLSSSSGITLLGTPNQVILNTVGNTTTLSTPQDIATSSTPTFAGVTLSGLTANRVVMTGASGQLTAPTALTNGQLLIGRTGNTPAAGAITSSTLTVSLGSGTISIEAPQAITTGSSPTFAAITLSGLTALRMVMTTASGQLATPQALTNGQIFIGRTGTVPVAGAITSTTLTVTLGNGTIAIEEPQALGTGASPTFTSLTISGVGGLTLSNLAANRIVTTTTGGLLTVASALTNGQLLIGSTGAAPVAGTISSTTLTVTTGAGTITINAPQAIGTGNSPTFTGITLSGLTGLRMVMTDPSGQLTTPAALTNGQIFIGRTGTVPTAGSITSTTLTVTLGNGTIAIEAPQALGTGSTPTFAGLTVSGLTANRVVTTNGASALTATSLTNGQLLIGNGGAFTAATLTGSTAQIAVANGAGSITLAFSNVIENPYVAFGPTIENSGTCGTGNVATSTVTGVSTSWTTAMAGGILYLNNLNSAFHIKRVINATSLELFTSQNLGSNANSFAIYYGGLSASASAAWSAVTTYVGTAQTGTALASPTTFNIIGPSSSNTGFQLYINDQRPAMQALAYTHGNGFWTFDAYYTGSQWISSDDNGAHRFNMQTGTMKLATSGAVTAGNTISTWTEYMTATNAGLVTFPLNAGVKFETSGGTASALNYYEEGTFEAITLASAGTDNPQGSGITAPVTAIRIGKMVTLQFSAKTYVSNALRTAIFALTVLPTRYRPISINPEFSIPVTNNDGFQNIKQSGYLSIGFSGQVTIAGYLNNGAIGFQNGGGTWNFGWGSFSITYYII